MNEAPSRSGLHRTLNVDDLKFSFHASSILEPKPSPTLHTRVFSDIITPQKESSQPNNNNPSSNSNSNSGVIKLDDVIAGLALSPDYLENMRTAQSSSKTHRVYSSPRKRNTDRSSAVCFSNYEYYEKRIIQPQHASYSNINGTSFLPEGNNYSGYGNEEKKDKKISNMPSIPDYDLQNIINEAQPSTKIQLPDHLIKVKRLNITKPLTIQGSPSCVLEVTDSVHVDLGKFSGEENTVVLSECIVKFAHAGNKDLLDQSAYTKRSKVSDTRPSTDRVHYTSNQFTTTLGNEIRRTEMENHSDLKTYPLFVVHSGSILEVRDCELSSKRNGGSAQDICFLLEHGGNIEEVQSIKETDQHPGISIQSSFIKNFHTAVQNNFLGRIYLEKLYISNILSHVINVCDPHTLEVIECTIEDMAKSGVNLRFSGECSADLKRKVVIEKSKFNKGGGSGINVYGDNMKAQVCNIDIIENQINSFKKDGMGIKNLNISQVTIEKNQITDSARNGIFLQNLLDTVSFHQVKLAENKISHSHLYGMILMDVSCYSEKDEISNNAKSGIFLSGGSNPITQEEIIFYRKYPLRTIFTLTNIHNNKDSGVSVMGYLKGPVILNSCGIHENTNGFYIKQSPQEVSVVGKMPQSAVNSACDPSVLSNIMLEKCVVTQNELSGIHLKQISTKMYLKETLIYDNRNYAIFIQNEGEKDNIIFKDGDKAKVREYISGYVGGSWGVLFEQNMSICRRANCNMF